MKVFVEDPENYLTALNVQVEDAIDPGQRAIMDAAHRSRLNWETYFFTNEANKATFDAAPWRYCGAVTDPVTRMRFVPDSASPRRDYQGVTYFFSSDTTATQFAALADSLSVPRHQMRKH